MPQLQRFVGEDPIEFAVGWNFYTYVDNSPLNFSDPEGFSQHGKRNLNVNLPNNTQVNESTPLKQIQDAIKNAKSQNWSKDTLKNLKALEKVVKRGGAMGIALELISPDDANAGEEELLCQAVPERCKPSKSRS